MTSFIQHYVDESLKIALLGRAYPGSLREDLTKTASTQFKITNDKYKYFAPDDKLAQHVYSACYKMALYSIEVFGNVGSYFVNGRLERDIEYLAYKMMVLFYYGTAEGTLRAYDKYTNKYCNNPSSQLRDVTAIHLPQCSEYGIPGYDIERLRQLLPLCGQSVLKKLPSMHKIEKKFGTIADDVLSFRKQLFAVHFPEAEENPELAKLADHYVTDSFGNILGFLKNGFIPLAPNGKDILPKQEDNIPDVATRYTNPETGSEYVLRKLDWDNKRSLMLGEITGNCQTLCGGGEDVDQLIVDSITRANHGFYVIINQGKKTLR